MLGMPGIKIASAITKIPTNESFKYAAAVGAQSTTGANVNQIPTKQQPHKLIGRFGLSDRHPRRTINTPETISLTVINRARVCWREVVASSKNQGPRPPLGSTHRFGLRYPKLKGAIISQNPNKTRVQ